jgi:transcriptional regulator with XRE-family HTH domain
MQATKKKRLRGIHVDGQAIAKFREEKMKWTQQQLADATGLSLRAIQRAEKDPAPIEPQNVLLIAHALGVYPVEILPWPPDAIPPAAGPLPGHTTVCIKMDMATERFNEFVQSRLANKLFAILGRLGIVMDVPHRIYVRKGSILVYADVTRADAVRLKAAEEVGDLRYLGIADVKIIRPWFDLYTGTLGALSLLCGLVGFVPVFVIAWPACLAGFVFACLGLAFAYKRQAGYTVPWAQFQNAAMQL